MKHKSAIWDFFVAFDEDNNVLSGSSVTKAKKVLCKKCDWEKSCNQTRMKRHLEECKGNEIAAEQEAPSPVVTSPIAKKQLVVSAFMDRKFTEPEQKTAQMAQAFAIVMSRTSHNQIEQSWTRDFLAYLRKDYVPLTRHTLLTCITELEVGLKEQVLWAISAAKYVAVAVDGWEDHQKFPTLGFTVHIPALYFKWSRTRCPSAWLLSFWNLSSNNCWWTPRNTPLQM
eukprot:EG_transcript_23972